MTRLKSEIDKDLPHPPSFERHIEITEKAVALHKRTLQAKKDKLQAASPKGALVDGRTKEMESAVGKVARKTADARRKGKEPKYKDAGDLQDLTGVRVVTNNIDEVLEAVANIKKTHKVIDEEDRISKAQDGYRSYHLIAEDENGLEYEIQVRTENQHTWAEWAHDVYKPTTEDEERSIAKHAQVLDDYRLKMSAYFLAEDDPKVKRFDKPDCPPEVKTTPFGCM